MLKSFKAIVWRKSQNLRFGQKLKPRPRTCNSVLKAKNIFEECIDVIEPSVNNDEHYEWLEQVTSTKTIVNEYEPWFFLL